MRPRKSSSSLGRKAPPGIGNQVGMFLLVVASREAVIFLFSSLNRTDEIIEISYNSQDLQEAMLVVEFRVSAALASRDQGRVSV